MIARKTIIMAGFSFVNGWVDALCILRYHVFATMMVGNMLSLGPAVSSHWLLGRKEETIPDPLFIMLMLIGFMLGVLLYRVLQRGFGLTGKSLAPFVTLWIILHDIGDCGLPDRRSTWSALRLTPLFGMQDAMCVKNGFGSLPWCTTNNIVTLAFGSTDVLLGGATDEEKTAIRNSAIMFSFMILGTLSGGLFGLTFRYRYGFTAIAIPLGCLFWLTPHWLGKKPETCSGEDKVPSDLNSSLLEADVSKDATQLDNGAHPLIEYRRAQSLPESLGIRIRAVESDLSLGG